MRSTFLAAAGALLCSAAMPATTLAQGLEPGHVHDLSDPRHVLEHAAEAMEKLETLTGVIEVGGEANGLLKFTSATADFKALRAVPPSERLTPMRIRLMGEGLTSRDRANTIEFDVIYDGSLATWLDAENTTLRSRDYKRALRQGYPAIEVSSALIINQLFEARPIRQMLVQRAAEPKLLDETTIAGVECFVVQFSFGDATETSSNTNTFYIGKDDYLVRRIERETNTEGNGISFSSNEFFELRDLNTTAPVAADQLTMAAPDGWEDETARVPQKPIEIPADAVQIPDDPKTLLPSFRLMNTSGEEVNTAEFRDGIHVLYVFGTWLRPSTKIAPDVQKIHEDFADKNVSVYGVTFRERDENAPRKFAEENGITFPILLDGDNMLQSLRVTQYPSIVIIDKQGFVLDTFNGSAAATRAADAISTYTAGSSEPAP